MGLILYDEVLGLQARSVERLADDSLSAQPAPGLQYAVPQGVSIIRYNGRYVLL